MRVRHALKIAFMASFLWDRKCRIVFLTVGTLSTACNGIRLVIIICDSEWNILTRVQHLEAPAPQLLCTHICICAVVYSLATSSPTHSYTNSSSILGSAQLHKLSLGQAKQPMYEYAESPTWWSKSCTKYGPIPWLCHNEHRQQGSVQTMWSMHNLKEDLVTMSHNRHHMMLLQWWYQDDYEVWWPASTVRGASAKVLSVSCGLKVATGAGAVQFSCRQLYRTFRFTFNTCMGPL